MRSTFIQADGDCVTVETKGTEILVHMLDEDLKRVATLTHPVKAPKGHRAELNYHRAIRATHADKGSKLVIKKSSLIL